MRPVALQDSTLGQGPLQVFGQNGTASMNAPFDRTQWQNLDSPIESVSLMSSGPRSQEATIQVNGDIWYRAQDGIRSLMVARRDFGTWANTAMSSEMARLLKYDDTELLEYGSSTLFDQRMLMTASPVLDINRGVYSRGLIAVDFDRVSSMLKRSSPAYDGLWTGVNVLQVLTATVGGRERCFMFALVDDAITLWEITKADPFDWDGSDDKAIEWRLETKAYAFEDEGWMLKSLATGDIWASELAGTVTFDVDFRPDGYPCWIDWHSWSECATREDCPSLDAQGCDTPVQYELQYRPRMGLPEPSSACSTTVGVPYRNGYTFQVRLNLTGKCALDRLRFTALDVPERSVGECRPSCTEVGLTACCDTDSFTYTI